MSSEDATPVQLPVVAVRDRVLFPGSLLRLSVGKPRTVRIVESLLSNREDIDHFHPAAGSGGGGLRSPNLLLAIFTQRVGLADEQGSSPSSASASSSPSSTVAASDGVATATREQPGSLGSDGAGGDDDGRGRDDRSRVLSTMSSVGCAAKVVQIGRVTGSDSFKYSVLVQGLSRIRLVGLAEEGPILQAVVVRLKDQGSIADAEVKALSLNLREAAQALLEVLKSRSHPRAMNAREILEGLSVASPGAVADVLASSINVPTDQKQAVLEEASLERRLRRVLELVREQTRVLSIASKINSEVEGKLNSRHREYYLRQQLKAIRSELGEDGASASEGDEMTELETKLGAAGLPGETSRVVGRDLARLKRMQATQPEYTVLRTYLETVAELPWNRTSEEVYDIHHAQRRLDEDHYGLAKVKRRIVEYIAVRSLMSDSKGSILCLVGPPGVGKTSLGRSIAAALNRKFQRLSLGGVHDEAEIRGHRRTYIGSMPGGIIRCLRRAGTRNPVMLLDEVDKMGLNVRGGDPSAALLEVLDPEQNATFTDHYLNVPFDLSSVLFVATANKIDTIPEPLLDRLEVIHIPGYTLEEKVKIAEAYLIPKQMKRNGVGPEHMLLPRTTVMKVASSYTREAGVRQLERELAALCRHVALKVGVWRQSSGSDNASGLSNAGGGEANPEDPHVRKGNASPHSVLSSSSSCCPSSTLVGCPRSEVSGPVKGSFERDSNDSNGSRSESSLLSGRPPADDAAVPALARGCGWRPSSSGGGGGGGGGEETLCRGIINAAGQGGSGAGARGGTGVDNTNSDKDDNQSSSSSSRQAKQVQQEGEEEGEGQEQGQGQGQEQQQERRHRRRRRQQQPTFARIVITREMLRGVLGPELYESEVAARVAVPGTCTGLAWTPTGGELLFIECTSMPGNGAVKLTGKLGEVMQESAQIALSWIRSHEREICDRLGLNGGGGGGGGRPRRAAGDGEDKGLELLFPPGFFRDTDLHVHVPAGGVPKDGPSAGVAITSAILSLLLGRAIDATVAMTGEMTLRGLVLPVGGIRDKVLAAHRGGIRHVLLPARNRGDVEELPPEAAEGLKFTFAENIDDVLLALFPAAAASAAAASAAAGATAAAAAAGDEIDVSPPPEEEAAAAAAAAAAGLESGEGGGGDARTTGLHGLLRGGRVGVAGVHTQEMQQQQRRRQQRPRRPLQPAVGTGNGGAAGGGGAARGGVSLGGIDDSGCGLEAEYVSEVLLESFL